MKILIVGINYAPEVTGIAPYTTELAEGLSARGHGVTVLTGLPHYPQWRVADDYSTSRGSVEVRNGVRIKRVRHFVPSDGSLRNRLRMECDFGRKACSSFWGNPDMVISVTPALASSAFVLARARIKGIPSGLIVQDLYGLGMQETAGESTAAMAAMVLESTVFRMAGGVAVIHEKFSDTVVGMGVKAARISVIRNWSHLRPREPLSALRVREVRSELGWRPDEYVVLHTGNIGLKQGLENVVRAARISEERGEPVRFVLVGDGNRRAELEREGRGLLNLQFLPTLPDREFADAMSAADILLVNEMPGVSGMAVPSKLTSYFTTGKPVLGAVDAGGVTAGEIRSAGAGVIIPPGQPDRMVTEAMMLGSNPDLSQ